jgi:hypothetical protein
LILLTRMDGRLSGGGTRAFKGKARGISPGLHVLRKQKEVRLSMSLLFYLKIVLNFFGTISARLRIRKDR